MLVQEKSLATPEGQGHHMEDTQLEPLYGISD